MKVFGQTRKIGTLITAWFKNSQQQLKTRSQVRDSNGSRSCEIIIT